MSALTGTPALIRLALRRDRIKLSLWILGIAGATAANVPGVLEFYGDTAQKQLTYAATTAPSIVSRIFGGPINGPSLGEIVINETFLFTAVAVALMSMFAVIRHTRQNEETGRAELIRSAIVGGQAQLTAALAVASGANILLGILITLVYLANDLPAKGSIGVGAALTALGIAFAGVAAITAQLSESARGASGMAAGALGVAFLLRGIGDGLGSLTQQGLAVASAWPSWLSPLGWAQQLYPFTKGNWWIFALYAALMPALIGSAFLLSSHRDVGLSILPARRGPARAAASLLSPFGLAWRLQRGVLVGWAVAIVAMGVTIGAVSKEFEKLMSDNEQIAEFLGSIGGTGNINDVLFTGMMALMAIAIGGYMVQALMRMRTEETAGRLEPLLAAHVSKPGWMLSHISCALIGVLTLVFLLGLSASTTFVAITNGSWSEVPRLTGAAFAYAPAILALGSLSVVFFGLLPRLAMALGWASFAACFFLAHFGALLKLPSWLLKSSPFAHSPAAPIEPITAQPLMILMAIALGLGLAGLFAFRRRDLTMA